MLEQSSPEGDDAPLLILCDYSLPGCNGHEVLRVARAASHTSGVPFFMLTGNNEQHMREETIRRGASQFIHKDDFCADINKWLGELLGIGDGVAA
jgi:CheY-like chemotaxis protein